MKFIRSFKYAIEGFLHCVKYERNFRVHLIVTTFVIVLAAILELSIYEILTLSVTIALVLICEMINTAIERTIDAIRELDERENPDIDKLRKIGKDVAAGAVFISSIFAVIVGIVIFLPKILEVLR